MPGPGVVAIDELLLVGPRGRVAMPGTGDGAGFQHAADVAYRLRLEGADGPIDGHIPVWSRRWMRVLYQHNVAAMEAMDLCGMPRIDAETARGTDAQHHDVAVAQHRALALVFARVDHARPLLRWSPDSAWSLPTSAAMVSVPMPMPMPMPMTMPMPIARASAPQ